MPKEISDQDTWNALPAGTAARVETFDYAEDGSEKDIIVYLVRVEPDIRLDAGDMILAGGKHWEDSWEWAEGFAVIDIREAFNAPSAD